MKKSAHEIIDMVAKQATEAYHKYPTLRFGQAVFNAAGDIGHKHSSELENALWEIRGGEVDPFFCDKNLQKFYDWLLSKGEFEWKD